MNLQRAVRVLWARRTLLVVAVGVSVGLAAIATLLAPKKYVADMALVVDAKGSDPLADTALSSPLLTAYMTTQREIIASRSVALKVIDIVGLSSIAGDRSISADPQQDPRNAYVASVLEPLSTSSSTNSNIIRVSYRSGDPEMAARMANAFGTAYFQTNLELQVDPARRQADWFEQQVGELRQELAQAQARLDAYQRDHGVLDVDEGRLDVENARLQEISSQLVKAQAAMYDAETRRSQASEASARNASELPDLLQNPLLQSLKSELARAEAKLADLNERVDRNHPQFRSANAEVVALRSQLNGEIATARGSLQQSADLARDQVRDVQAALNEQKARIISLRRQRDELAVLDRDVQSARAAYDAGLQQANEARLQSRITRTNIAILNQATVPSAPASPVLTLNLALALIVGTVLAAGWVLYAEYLMPRLRSAEDLLELGDLVTLAELPALPPPTRRQRRLPKKAALRLQPQMRPRLT